MARISTKNLWCLNKEAENQEAEEEEEEGEGRGG